MVINGGLCNKKASCGESSMGTRILKHSLSGRADQDFADTLERTRLEQAAILVRQGVRRD